MIYVLHFFLYYIAYIVQCSVWNLLKKSHLTGAVLAGKFKDLDNQQYKPKEFILSAKMRHFWVILVILKNPVFVLDLWLFCFLVCYGQTLNKFRYFFQVNWTCGTHCRKTSWAVICEIFHVTSMLSFYSEKNSLKIGKSSSHSLVVLKSLKIVRVSFYT